MLREARSHTTACVFTSTTSSLTCLLLLLLQRALVLRVCVLPLYCSPKVTNLEKRLALLEGREAAVTSQLRIAEAAAAEGDAAAAENASLREQLRELKRDKSQLEQHKNVSGAGRVATTHQQQQGAAVPCALLILLLVAACFRQMPAVLRSEQNLSP